MSSRKQEADKLWRRMRRQGFTVERTSGGHMRITHPDMRVSVISSSTPSDHHSQRNLQAQVRRAMKGDTNG